MTEGTVTSEGKHPQVTGHDGVIYLSTRKLPLGTRVIFTAAYEATGPVATRIKVVG
jgi:hypothetical protein